MKGLVTGTKGHLGDGVVKQLLVKNDLTVVFIGFDGYSDLWNDCIRLYKKFWPDCPYRTLFVNNTKDVSWDGIEVLHAGPTAEWSRKMQLAIEKIETPYICLLLEDFFVSKQIDTKVVEDTMAFVKKEGIRYFKLANISRAVHNRDPKYKGVNYLHVIPEADEYGVSIQPAIWKKEYLTELIGEGNYSAWMFEFARVKESNEKSKRPRDGCVFDDRNILNIKHGVVQSKYIPGTIRYFSRMDETLNIEREVLSYSAYCKIKFVSFCKYSLPRVLRKPIKKIMEKAGYNFVSTMRK
jgi:hypothetical protein